MSISVADGSAEERAKYEEIWGLEEYQKAFSPGESNVERFVSVVKPVRHQTLIDVGCGRGRAGLMFSREHGLNCEWLDITSVALDPDVPGNLFHEQPIWAPIDPDFRFDYSFCVDVMEHIPTEYTMLCLDRVIQMGRTAWFQIANLPDKFGALIGQPLHLTVQPYKWWLTRMATLGTVVDARDLCGLSLFVVRR